MRGEITALLTRGTQERFGFLRGEDGFDRYFAQRNLIGIEWGDLAKGATVEFIPTVGGRDGNGLRAENIRVVPA